MMVICKHLGFEDESTNPQNIPGIKVCSVFFKIPN